MRCFVGYNFNIISGFRVFGKLKSLHRNTQAPHLAPAMRCPPPPCKKYYPTALVSNTQRKHFTVGRSARPVGRRPARQTGRLTGPSDWPAERPASRPAGLTTASPTDRSAGRYADRPSDCPNQRKKASRPGDRLAGQPAGRSHRTDERHGRPIGRQTGRPADQPGSRAAAQSDEASVGGLIRIPLGKSWLMGRQDNNFMG